MQKMVSNSVLHKSRRPSKLGDELAKQKIDEAQSLTPEQRLLVALELSDAAAALQRACSRKP
jgi:hypothetical protein